MSLRVRFTDGAAGPEHFEASLRDGLETLANHEEAGKLPLLKTLGDRLRIERDETDLVVAMSFDDDLVSMAGMGTATLPYLFLSARTEAVVVREIELKPGLEATEVDLGEPVPKEEAVEEPVIEEAEVVPPKGRKKGGKAPR